MALLLSHLSLVPSSSLSSSFSSSSSHSPSIAIVATSALSHKIVPKNLSLHSHGVRISSVKSGRMRLIVRAVSETDGKEDPLPPSQGAEEATVGVENLPLESKEREKMEQKARMKLAKKIRLRRKRLVHKRHLRKKGRWPPSKMKKLKNV